MSATISVASRDVEMGMGEVRLVVWATAVDEGGRTDLLLRDGWSGRSVMRTDNWRQDGTGLVA